MEREFRLEQGVIDLATGEFPARVATNGEASDRHILDIATLIVPASVPMFVNHDPSPVSRMGQLNSPRTSGKTMKLGGATLHMRGRIDMEGDSAAADIRRDVAQGIHVGDITAMSTRWGDDFEGVARSSLAKHHFAYREDLGGWNTPLFIKAATILENSIVGLGADQAALIGRSQDVNRAPHVREFYAMLAQGDRLSREQALTCLYEEAGRIDELESIETASGAFFVPRDVAGVWGQSIEFDEPRIAYLERGATIEITTDDPIDSPGDLPEASREESASADEPPEPTREDAASAERPSTPELAVSDGTLSALDTVQAYRKKREAQSDRELTEFAEQLLYKRKGTIPNGP